MLVQLPMNIVLNKSNKAPSRSHGEFFEEENTAAAVDVFSLKIAALLFAVTRQKSLRFL